MSEPFPVIAGTVFKPASNVRIAASFVPPQRPPQPGRPYFYAFGPQRRR
jgi:hypothetical protein